MPYLEQAKINLEDKDKYLEQAKIKIKIKQRKGTDKDKIKGAIPGTRKDKFFDHFDNNKSATNIVMNT